MLHTLAVVMGQNQTTHFNKLILWFVNETIILPTIRNFLKCFGCMSINLFVMYLLSEELSR